MGVLIGKRPAGDCQFTMVSRPLIENSGFTGESWGPTDGASLVMNYKKI